MDQQTDEHLRYEADGDAEDCWAMLLHRLNGYRAEPAEARRNAEALWAGLYWPGDIDAFHTLLRRALTAMRRIHCPLHDYQIVHRYLELIPAEKAKMLEDPIRRPPMGYDHETLIKRRPRNSLASIAPMMAMEPEVILNRVQ